MSSQIIYSIDNSKKRIYIDLETRKETLYNIDPEHKYDLANTNKHYSDGTIKKSELQSYNQVFVYRIKRIFNPEQVRQYLHHHLKHHISKGGEQNVYFQVLHDFVTYQYTGAFRDQPTVKDLILNWIEKESSGFEERIFYDTSFEEPDSKYQCQIRAKDLKDPILSYQDLIDNAFSLRYIENDIFNYFDEIEKFLEHHYNWYEYDKKNWLKYTERIIKEYKALHSGNGKDVARHNHALEWLAKHSNSEIANMNHNKQTINKIKWLGSPSQFGYIMNELAEKGFIEMPKTHGNPSMDKFGKQLFEAFEIDSTLQNIQKEINPLKNTLSDFNRMKINIPNISDLK